MLPSAPTTLIVNRIPHLAPRNADANKGTFGRVFVVAGSRGMSGAAILCGSGALRGGAGLVFLGIPESILDIVATANPCYLTVPLPQDAAGRLAAGALPEVLDRVRRSTVAVLGPGLGQSAELSSLLQAVLEHTETPLVLDADALNNLAAHTEWLHRQRGGLVLTPHPGEFARLVKSDIPSIQARRQDYAVNFAAEHGVVVVLKGRHTVVTDGHRLYVNTTGNPGMATGGTGDVLTGLIGALLAQQMETFAAAQLGVYLHGLAGDLARDEVGETALIASDLLHNLPWALQHHARQQP
jgi:ADP-dependent NAD(P)H-hydrate dehydratase